MCQKLNLGGLQTKPPLPNGPHPSFRPPRKQPRPSLAATTRLDNFHGFCMVQVFIKTLACMRNKGVAVLKRCRVVTDYQSGCVGALEGGFLQEMNVRGVHLGFDWRSGVLYGDRGRDEVAVEWDASHQRCVVGALRCSGENR